MTIRHLDEIQRLVDELSPPDQARLLEHLSLNISRMIAETQTLSSPTSQSAHDRAWDAFLRLGDDLAASDSPEAMTLTQAVLSMRR